MVDVQNDFADPKGSLFVRGFARYDETLKRPFQVGTICFGSVRIRGQGASWEGAFNDGARQTNTEPAATALVPRTSVRPTRPISNPLTVQKTTARGPEGRPRA